MAYPHTTKSVPGGCFLGTLALFPIAVAILGCWGLISWAGLPPMNRHFNSDFWALLAAAVLGSLAAFGMIRLSIKVLRSTDFRRFETKDPDEDGLKW